MTNLPMEALDCQVDLIRYYLSQSGRRYTATWFLGADLPGSTVTAADVDASAYGTWFGDILGYAETFAVSEEIVGVLEQAVEQMPDFEVRPHDVPAPEGFVYFERPVHIVDDYGKQMAVKAVAWTPVVTEAEGRGVMHLRRLRPDLDGISPATDPEVVDGVMFAIYTDPEDDYDHSHAEHLDIQRALREELKGIPWTPPRYSAMVAGRVDFGRPLSHVRGEPLYDQDRDGNGYVEPDPDRDLRRIVFALWRFVGEEWVDHRAIVGPRASQKRAVRIGLSPEVRVIRLRRAADKRYAPGAEEHHYSHRFPVSGHWRNQWYPSEQRHAPKWIPAYIKGPEGAPLLIRDRVFHVDR